MKQYDYGVSSHLLTEHRLGLTTVTGLLGVVTTLTLAHRGLLTGLVLRHLGVVRFRRFSEFFDEHTTGYVSRVETSSDNSRKCVFH